MDKSIKVNILLNSALTIPPVDKEYGDNYSVTVMGVMADMTALRVFYIYSSNYYVAYETTAPVDIIGWLYLSPLDSSEE